MFDSPLGAPVPMRGRDISAHIALNCRPLAKLVNYFSVTGDNFPDCPPAAGGALGID